MMYLLAIETATEACSAALWADGHVLWEIESAATRRHGELILRQIDALLAEAELVPAQIDALAVSRGPGAFTGVRLGLGVAQGLGFALDRPVVPVSTLAALAQQGVAGGATTVIPVLDARMGEVYWARLNPVAGFVALGPEHLSVPATVGPHLAGSDAVNSAGLGKQASYVLLGSGLAVYPEIVHGFAPESLVAVHPQAQPRALEVAQLGAAAFARGEAVSAELALPVYLRDRVAEPGPRP